MSIHNYFTIILKQWGLLHCFFAFIVGSATMQASTPIEITSVADWKKTLITELEVLPDEKNEYSLIQLLRDSSIIFKNNINERPIGYIYWGKIKIKNKSNQDEPISFASNYWDFVDLYIQSAAGKIDTLYLGVLTKTFRPDYLIPKDAEVTLFAKFISRGEFRREENINLIIQKTLPGLQKSAFSKYMDGIIFGIMFGLTLYNLFLFISLKDQTYLWYTIYIFAFTISYLTLFSSSPSNWTQYLMPGSPRIAFYIKKLSDPIVWIAYTQFTRLFLHSAIRYPFLDKIIKFLIGLIIIQFIINWLGIYQFSGIERIIIWHLTILFCFTLALISYLNGYTNAKFFIIGQIVVLFGLTIVEFYFAKIDVIGFLPHTPFVNYFRSPNSVFFCGAVESILFSFALAGKYNDLQKDITKVTFEKEQEKQSMMTAQNEKLEQLVIVRTGELNKSIELLKTTQAQLIQSEKMASLGELTSGIAHEIQNPLNFITNFSELNLEILEEIETNQNGHSTTTQTLNNLKKNSEKIQHHGKRVDSIVKGMLQHSRQGTVTTELVDVNSLCEESLKLAYHAYKAKDKAFNAKYETSFDKSLTKIQVVTQDFSRVLLNIINNAFYAVNLKNKKSTDYIPSVKITTKANNLEISIFISDNGEGIPSAIIDKIFQPFFTTKPTGEGTGLGLSMAYDIITKGHGGELKVKSKEGLGTEFEIVLPCANNC